VDVAIPITCHSVFPIHGGQNLVTARLNWHMQGAEHAWMIQHLQQQQQQQQQRQQQQQKFLQDQDATGVWQCKA
jgi:hypothetical protein